MPPGRWPPPGRSHTRCGRRFTAFATFYANSRDREGMDVHEFNRAAEGFYHAAVEAFAAAETPEQLEVQRIRFLGDRESLLKTLQAELRDVDKPLKPEAGMSFNKYKNLAINAYEVRLEAVRGASAPPSASRDLTMPARRQWHGARHPITLVIEETVAIFRELGFTIALGPEVETEWYNFGALNFPPHHPAMDMHDTLYIRDDVLLRTHTSPVQIRTLQRYAPPIRILAPGNAYRRDFFDASHAPMFTQIEGLSVDEGVSFVDLKATLTHFARAFFGPTKTRFRPSFFPFTEPSAEMDIECRLCEGVGCAACKGTGWMEILGSGMVDPSVLDAAGVDRDRKS